MTFGPSAAEVHRIGGGWIDGTHGEEVGIPDGVRELCDDCLKGSFSASEVDGVLRAHCQPVSTCLRRFS